jgi:hypothetical protein
LFVLVCVVVLDELAAGCGIATIGPAESASAPASTVAFHVFIEYPQKRTNRTEDYKPCSGLEVAGLWRKNERPVLGGTGLLALEGSYAN